MSAALRGKFSQDLAMDLGTANTLIYVKGRGVVLNEPSVVVINQHSGELISIGKEAKQMIGRTPEGIKAIRPLKDGVIAEYEEAKLMIKHFIAEAMERRLFFRPRMVICVPSGITSVEKKAVVDSAEQAGAKEVFLVEEPMAAAIGANLPIHEAIGSMIVDIGGGTTEVAVISMSGIVQSNSQRVAGDKIDEAIMEYFRRVHKMKVGLSLAEEIKIRIGSAYSRPREISMEVPGVDLSLGVPKQVTVTDSELREGIREPVQAIVKAVRDTIEKTPPELVSDIVERGIVLTGGTSQLRGLDELLAKEIRIQVHLSEAPLLCVVHGTGQVLDDGGLLEKIVIN